MTDCFTSPAPVPEVANDNGTTPPDDPFWLLLESPSLVDVRQAAAAADPGPRW